MHEDEERELDRLLAKARPIKDEAADLLMVSGAIHAERFSLQADDLHSAELTFAKWRVLHKYFYARPFRTSAEQKRSQQWRDVARICAPLNDPVLNDWIAMQIDVASNRERGISDLRIRRDGPCFLILLEYVSNKKRTALAVLHWAKSQASDETSDEVR